MLAVAGAVLGLLMYALMTPPPRRNQRKVYQRKVYQNVIEVSTRSAARAASSANIARRELRRALRVLRDYEWGAQFHADSLPSHAEGMARNIPRLQATIDQCSAQVEASEKVAEHALAQVAVYQAKLDRITPKVRETPGLVVLVQVCWAGARRR